jgi:ribosomal protein S25
MAKQWYHKVGFETYPLDPRSNPNLIGVEDIESKLISYIQQGNMCLLCGLTGTGKTSMLQKVMNSPELKNFEFLFISSDGIKKDKEIMALVKEKMSILQKILFKKPKNMVILLDECQVASRILTESIKSKWNEAYETGDKVIQSVVVSQIPSRLNSNFSGSFMDRLGKRVVKMRKLAPKDLKDVLYRRLQLNAKKNLIDKFEKKALDFLVKSCDGSVRQLLEYTDVVLREIDRLDPQALSNSRFKISQENVFTFLQASGLVVETRYEYDSKTTFKEVFKSEKLSKAVEMFDEFNVLNTVQLAEKLDASKRVAQTIIKKLEKEGAILISHSEDKDKFYVLTPRMKHEVVRD